MPFKENYPASRCIEKLSRPGIEEESYVISRKKKKKEKKYQELCEKKKGEEEREWTLSIYILL